MNRSETAMTPEQIRRRKALFREVEYGRISPAEADVQLRRWGQQPFQKRLDTSQFDPMTEEEWTLAMAAAWFIWRSLDAVRDQWNAARQGWQKWIPYTPPPRPKGLIVPRNSKPPPSLIRKGFGRATLADVYSQARPPGASQGDSLQAAFTHSPYGRLREALGSGQLQATRGRSSSGNAEKILREYWQRQFDAEAAGKTQQLPSSSELRRFIASTRNLTGTNVQVRDVKIGSEHDLDKLLEEIDASIGWDGTKYKKWKRDYDNSLSDLNDVFIGRHDVIRIEQRLSEQEYDGLDWNIGQALGWVAYQKQGTFRSLWKADLNPHPTYYGETYSPDFVASDPAAALKQELLSETLVGYQDGEAVRSISWIGSEVWDRPGMRFMRADIIKIWKELPLAVPAKKPRPSKEQMTEIHEGLEAERGSQPSEQAFRDKLEEGGFDSNVRHTRQFRKNYAAEKGIRLEPGPRGKHKPRPNSTQRLEES
jgi:hypothetical protein